VVLVRADNWVKIRAVNDDVKVGKGLRYSLGMHWVRVIEVEVWNCWNCKITYSAIPKAGDFRGRATQF